MRLIWAMILSFCLAGCSDDPPADGDGDVETDGDVDADSDADSDADGDVDGDADGDSDADLDEETGCLDDADCDDGVDCTADSCDPLTRECRSEPDHDSCDPGEVCDPDSDCVEVTCSEDAHCDDGFFCNGLERCDTTAWICLSGTSVDCNDGIDCTRESCDEASEGCLISPDDDACDDGLFCTGVETCDEESGCLGGETPVCDDGVDCSSDSCDPLGDECVGLPDHSLCDSGELCRPDEGGCVEVPDCDEDVECDDGLWCNGAETCVESACVAGEVPLCDDEIECTRDGCDEDADACRSVVHHPFCDDGDFCNGAETCSSDEGCLSGEVPDECLLTCDSVEPGSGSIGADIELTVTGAHIVEGAHLLLENREGARTDYGAVAVAADGASATALVRAGTLDAGSYTVFLANPHFETGCGMYEALPALSCSEVEPPTISVLVESTVILHGVRGAEGGEVVAVDVDTDERFSLGEPVLDADRETATVDIAAGVLPPGLYSLLVIDSEGDEALCRNRLHVTSLPPPTVTDVIPPSAWEGDPADDVLSDQAVTVVGSDFLISPGVTWVLVIDPSVRYEALEVSWLSESELAAVCPSETRGMPPGEYHVLVTNPDGLTAWWTDETTDERGIFEVTAVPPPRIDAIEPVRSPASDPVTLTVSGIHFADGAEVSLELPEGDLLTLATTFRSDDELEALLPAGAVSAGRYPVRVTNPDGRYDVYYVYTATESAEGHLNGPFELDGETSLLTGRERLDSIWGFDVFGNTYVYVVGGVDGTETVLGDTELAHVSVFGRLGQFRQAEQYGGPLRPRIVNGLVEPRQGLAVVRAGPWVYAIGGASAVTNTSSSVTALRSVERARIMGYDTMPESHRPVVHGGSGLPFGTWYYRISAVGPFGESLGSREVQARSVSGEIEVCWSSRTDDATAYNVYRSPAADGRAGTTRLLSLEEEGDCFLDTGRGEHQPAPGRLRSSLEDGGGLEVGVWTYRVTAVVGGVETIAGYRQHVDVIDASESAISLRWDTVRAATFNVYRTADGAAAASGDEATFLLAEGLETNEFLDDGSAEVDASAPAPDGIAPLPPGSLSLWEVLAETPLEERREGADGIVVAVPSMTEDDPDSPMIYVAGGRPDNSGEGYHDTIERTGVAVDGSLTGWEIVDERMNEPRAFLVLLSTLDRDVPPVAPPPVDPGCPDFDGDGHRDDSCGGDDCDDTDPTIHPGAEEICGDGIDQDCDGIDPECDCTEPDADGDGFDSYDCGGDDCNDDDDSIYPGAEEICGDGIDQDCNGSDLACDCLEDDDWDDDGWIRPECGGQDCDDEDPTVFPGAPEIPCDGIDQDCNSIDECFFPSIITEPIYLIVGQGDDMYDDRRNAGLATFEASRLFPPLGTLGPWTIQDNEPSHERHGHGALLYFDFVFTLPGVQREDLGEHPTPGSYSASRFPLDVEERDTSELLDRFESAAASFEVARAYYGTVRVNSRIFILGGNDGSGPLGSIELHDE